MKKILLSSLLVCSALTACTQWEEEEPMVAIEGQVCFTGSVGSASRATASAFEEGDSITLFAFKGEGDPWSAGNAPSSANVKYGYNGTLFTAAKGGITYPEHTPLSFLAVYPAITSTASSFNFYVEEDQSLEDHYTKSDLMTAFATNTSEPVPNLVFSHRLSSIVVNLTFEQMPAGTTHVSFSSAKTVNVDLAADTYVGGGGNILAIRAAANGTNSYKAILPPQTVSSGWELIHIEAEGGHTYRYALPGELILKSGKQRTFDLTVTAGGEVIVTAERESEYGGQFTVSPSDGSADVTFTYQGMENGANLGFIIDNYFRYDGYGTATPLANIDEMELIIDEYSASQKSYEDIVFRVLGDSYPRLGFNWSAEDSQISAEVTKQGMDMKVILSGTGHLNRGQPTVPATIISGELLLPLSYIGTMRQNVANISELNFPNLGFDVPFPADNALVITQGGSMYIRGGRLYYKEGSAARYDEMKQKIEAAGYALQSEEVNLPQSKVGEWVKGNVVLSVDFSSSGFEIIPENDGVFYHLGITAVELSSSVARSAAAPLLHMNKIEKPRNKQ